MQDLKLNGIYIAIGHSTRHNIVKFQVLEITKTSYYILWLDVNQKARYDKEQFAFDYRIVETIEEPEPIELTTNYLAKNFLGITEEELKNNEKLRIMTQTIYGLIGNDGYDYQMYWFRDKLILDYVNNAYTGLGMFINIDSNRPIELTFPADLDLEKCGFEFFSSEDYK